MTELQSGAGLGKQVTVKVDNTEKWQQLVIEKFPMAVTHQNNEFIMPAENNDDVAAINREMVMMGIPVKGIRTNEGLEEWFIKMTSN